MSGNRCRHFWFLLVSNEHGHSYMRSVSAVSLKLTDTIYDLKKAVKADFANSVLRGVAPCDLLVYKNQSAFEKRNASEGKGEPLDDDLPLLGDLGLTEEDALIVAIPWTRTLLTAEIPSSSLCDFDFFNNLCKAQQNDEWIDFQTEIPPFSLNVTRLYVRESYKTIAKAILSGRQTIVSGTPGTGKSFFLIYLLWTLVQQNKRVLFVYEPYTIYYDGQGMVLTMDQLPRADDEHFFRKDLWCLIDAKFKGKYDLYHFTSYISNMIVATYPQRELVSSFQERYSAKWFFMPIWSEGELTTLSSMYPNAVDWYERFNILGGIPQWVFESTEDPRKLLENACKVCSLEDCLSAFSYYSYVLEDFHALHHLIHIESSDPFTRVTLSFASPEAMKLLAKVQAQNAKLNMASLLMYCNQNPLTAAFCTHYFQQYVIQLFEVGGTFHCSEVSQQGINRSETTGTTITIKKQTRAIIHEVHCNQEPDQLYVPKSRNVASIDAWIPSIGGFQITMDIAHEISESAYPLLQMLPKKLFWVIPSSKYDSFTHQPLSDTTIKQYVVPVPFPERIMNPS